MDFLASQIVYDIVLVIGVFGIVFICLLFVWLVAQLPGKRHDSNGSTPPCYVILVLNP